MSAFYKTKGHYTNFPGVKPEGKNILWYNIDPVLLVTSKYYKLFRRKKVGSLIKEWRNTPLEDLDNVWKKLPQYTYYKYGKTIYATQAFSILLLLQIGMKKNF